MQFKELSLQIFQSDVYTIDLQIFGAPQREIRSVHYLDGTAPVFREDRLYIGDMTHFPEFPAPDGTVNLILCGAGAPPARPLGSKGLNYLHIENADAAPLVYNRLRLALSPRSSDELLQMQRLTEAFLSNKGLQYLADTAGEVFQNPMRISDMSYNYLVRLDMESSPDPFLQEFIDGRTSDAHVDYGNQQRIRERQRDLRYPILNPIPPVERGPNVLGSAMLSAPVFIQDVVVAYCSLYDAFRPYKPEDYALLSFFCSLVSAELQKSSYYAENKGLLHAHFLHDLLARRLSGIKDLRQRLRTIGWSPKTDLYILAVDLGHSQGLSINPALIAQRLQRASGHCIYTLMEDRIALLLSRDSGQPVENEALRRFLADTNLKAGLSARFTDILDAPQYYESALAAAQLGALLAPAERLYRFTDYAVPLLLQGHDRGLLLSSLAEGALPRLLAHDEKQAPPLVPTLRAWLENDLSSSGAAAALGIHKNTLLYRLDRIRTLTDLSLSGGNELLQLLLALKLLDAAGPTQAPNTQIRHSV